MKRLVLIIPLFFFAFYVQAQETLVKSGPVIKFEEKVHDFKVITQGDIVEHTFVYENIGTEPLRIISARGSCGCTVPKYSKEDIAPGAKGEVLVRFNSAGKMGKQNKTVTLVTNATTNNRIVLTVRGTIEAKTIDGQ